MIEGMEPNAAHVVARLLGNKFEISFRKCVKMSVDDHGLFLQDERHRAVRSQS